MEIFSKNSTPGQTSGQVEARITNDGLRVEVFDADSGEKKFEVSHGGNWIIWDVAVSPDGKYLATAGRDTTSRLWSARTGQLVRVVIKGGEGGEDAHYGYVWSLAF